MMTGITGIEVLRRLRAAGEPVPVLMLTAKDAPQDEIQGLKQGADDYVVKPFTFEVLLARIHALLRRFETEHPQVLSLADLKLDTGAYRARRGTRTIDLTNTEYKLLSLLLEHPRQVLSRDILMERVWGYDFGGDENVLETYIKQLRQKLEADGEARLIHTVRGVGYVLREE
jgi:two-component system response regulator MprA